MCHPYPRSAFSIALGRKVPSPLLQQNTSHNTKLSCLNEKKTELLLVCKVKVAQLFPTLCNPMDYTVHGILQARILEWVAFPFSRCSSQHHIVGGFFTSWATKEDQEYGVGSLFLLQQIFLTQESNQGLLHCRRILYQLSYQETPSPPRLQLVCKLVPKHRGEGETKERGRPLQVGSGSFNKQGNLCMRLDLCDHKTCRSLHPPTRILKAYIETLAGFSHTFSQMVSTTNLNKSLKDTAPCVGLLGRRFTPRARSGYIPRARAG